MTCTCTRDSNGELHPIGCTEHGEVENARSAHRHGKVWRDLDGNEVVGLSRIELGWLSAGVSILLAVVVCVVHRMGSGAWPWQ